MTPPSAEDSRIRALFDASQRFLLTAHIRPDGDAVGSLLGLGLALEAAGKTVHMLLEDGVPSAYRHLKGSEKVEKKFRGEADVFITLDCADMGRVSESLAAYAPPSLNVDHHITNKQFAEINLVEPHAVSTASVLFHHMPAWGLEISLPVAEALLTGIVTDTLGFRTSNMTPQALRDAALLMEKGADLPALYTKSLHRRSFEATKYWGAGLSKLEHSDTMVWGTLTLDDRKFAQYYGNDDADLINIIASIEGKTVAMIFVEQPGGKVKVSWRTREAALDVSRIAVLFGGGGHKGAAGATLSGAMDEVQARVLEETRKAIKTLR